MKVYYRVTVGRISVEDRDPPVPRFGSVVSSVPKTMNEAFQVAFDYAVFYQGPKGAGVTIERVCEVCNGQGIVKRKSGRGTVRCPECKTKDSEVTIVDTTVVPGESITILRHGKQVFPKWEGE